MNNNAIDGPRALALSTLRRQAPLVIVCGIVGALVGLVLGLGRPPVFTSTATVLVNPVQGAPFSPESRNNQVNLQTEAALVGTPAVADIARSILGDQSAVDADLRNQVSTVVPPSTQVLEISFTALDAPAAQQGAQAFADAFLVYREQRAQEVVERQLAAITEQRATVESNLREATAQLSTDEDDAANQNYLNQLVESYTSQLSALDGEASGLSDVSIVPGQVVSPAEVPGSASGLDLSVYVLAGLLAGLTAGISVGLLRERTDDRLRDPAQLGDGRVLAVLPRAARTAAEPITVTEPSSAASEGYRRLRVAVGTTVPAGRALCVSSVSADRSAAAVAANLSVSISRTGGTVVLVDASGRDEAAELLGSAGGTGLSEALLDAVPVTQLTRGTASGPMIVSGGKRPTLAGERYLSSGLRTVLDDLRSPSDMVIVAAPPVTSADGESLASMVDGVILVVTLGHTTSLDVANARETLQAIGATIVGLVVQEPPRRRGRQRSSGHPGPSSDGSADVESPDPGDDPRRVSPAHAPLHSSP